MLQGVKPYSLDPSSQQQSKTIARFASGLLPDIATNSAAITKEKLPPSYSQFYQNGTDNRLYCNINNSIFSIDLINANAAKRKTGTFVNSDLATGILTITHNFGLSAPYMA